jgi:hypothetical protein
LRTTNFSEIAFSLCIIKEGISEFSFPAIYELACSKGMEINWCFVISEFRSVYYTYSMLLETFFEASFDDLGSLASFDDFKPPPYLLS